MTRSVFYFYTKYSESIPIIIITLKRSGHFHHTLAISPSLLWMVCMNIAIWLVFFVDLYVVLVFSSGKTDARMEHG